MRISDWSSDVCSSDLIYEEFAEGFAERTRAVTVGNGAAAGVQMGPMANPRRPAAVAAMIDDAAAKGARLQIGRASCRERVWQYGSLAVVYVSFIKEKDHSIFKSNM